MRRQRTSSFSADLQHLVAPRAQAANQTLRAMLDGSEAGAAAVAADLEGTRRQLLDEEEVAGARFLAVLQVCAGRLLHLREHCSLPSGARVLSLRTGNQMCLACGSTTARETVIHGGSLSTCQHTAGPHVLECGSSATNSCAVLNGGAARRHQRKYCLCAWLDPMNTSYA